MGKKVKKENGKKVNWIATTLPLYLFTTQTTYPRASLSTRATYSTIASSLGLP